MPKIIIDGKDFEVEENLSIIQACEVSGVEIPRFCYHEKLSVAGNCRMCLVDIEDARGMSPKPVASCAMQVSDGLKIHTKTQRVKKAREGVMEFLLINHPLDCPICDQGGECDLQDQSVAYGLGGSRYEQNKRSVENKDMGPFIKTEMNRCIHCTRCVRFSTEVSGSDEIGAIGRGRDMEITTYLDIAVKSELSGNVIDLCPVGALTSKPYAFSARPWELKQTESIDVMDAVGSNIRIDTKGNKVMRVLPRNNDEVNEEWISDKTRFFWDGLSLQRIDKPYLRENGKLRQVSWKKAIDVASDKLLNTNPKKIASITGDLVSIESIYSIKKLMDTIKSPNTECRQDGSKINGGREKWLFNSKLSGIDVSDGCLLIGTNPRIEAALINSRIVRKSKEKNYSIGLLGNKSELNYNYDYLGDDPSIIYDLIDNKNPFCEKLSEMNKPIMIIGQGALKGDEGEDYLNLCIELANNYNFLKNDWNGFNVLHTAASRPGAMEIGFLPKERGKDLDQIIDGYKKGDISTLFLLGADEIEISEKTDCFVIYQGHHGDKGANIADLILPSPSFNEQNGLFINTEGRIQESIRATFPIGEAKEDWEIISLISKKMGLENIDNSFEDLRSSLFQSFPHLADIDMCLSGEKLPEKIERKDIRQHVFKNSLNNFWLSNSITRSSRLMCERNNISVKTTAGD
ncbi:MAG: NADH-quinone oxidoreductase subunit NuoG [Pseudomonadota bacterium]|nr:NADH-quinone oxidoreductase subunit NuoG [Pseudomonadota bacterium]